MFVHHHVHSEFSLLDGAIKVDALCKRAKEMGQTAVAITDHGWIAGAIKFVEAAEEAEIKPIIGMETYLASDGDMSEKAKNAGDNYHLTLLAKDAVGYSNLVILTSLAHRDGFSYRARIDHTLLQEHKKGVIVLSGCIGAQIPETIIKEGLVAGRKLAESYQDMYGANFFIELMAHGSTGGVDHVRQIDKSSGEVLMTETDLNGALVDIAKQLGVPMVATNDAHYLKREHGDIHDTMLCLSMGTFKENLERMRFPGAKQRAWEFYIKDEKEMLAMSNEWWWREACANTQTLADMISPNVIPLGLDIMPQFKIPRDMDFQRWQITR